MEKNSNRKYYCSNPFLRHSIRNNKNLRTVSGYLSLKFPQLTKGDTICNPCRNRCYKECRSRVKSDYRTHKRRLRNEENNSSRISVDANQEADGQHMEYNLNNVFIQNENVETGDLGFTEDDSFANIDLNEHIKEELIGYRNFEAYDSELTEVTNKEAQVKRVVQVKSEENLDSKKIHILSMVNVLIQEFDEFPINSIDSSAPGGIEKKLDVLFNNIKSLFIENFTPGAIS